jgi:hypothetical protein
MKGKLYIVKDTSQTGAPAREKTYPRVRELTSVAELPSLLRPEQAANECGLVKQSIWNAMESGRLSVVLIGEERTPYLTLNDLAAYLNARTPPKNSKGQPSKRLRELVAKLPLPLSQVA